MPMVASRTMAVMASRYGLSRVTTSSGVSRSDMLVKPRMSENRMLTSERLFSELISRVASSWSTISGEMKRVNRLRTRRRSRSWDTACSMLGRTTPRKSISSGWTRGR